METLRRAAAPGYVVAALMIAYPLVDLLLAAWPVEPGQVAWRFGAAGLLSRELPIPMLGILLAFLLALGLEQRAMLRMITGLSAALLLVTLATALLFALDSVQIRAEFNAEARRAAAAASIVALTKFLGLSLVLLLIGVNGWRASRGRPRHERKAAGAGDLIRAGVGGTAAPAVSAKRG